MAGSWCRGAPWNISVFRVFSVLPVLRQWPGVAGFINTYFLLKSPRDILNHSVVGEGERAGGAREEQEKAGCLSLRK